MIKFLTTSLLITFAVASAQIHAEDNNSAYIREQVKQTLAGAAQNQNRIDQSEIVDLVNNSNANAKRFNADAVSINNNAQNYLKSQQARNVQQWAIETNQGLQAKPEYKQNTKYGIEACKEAARKIGMPMKCGNVN